MKKTTTYAAEFSSVTVPKPRQTETLTGGSGWFVVKYVDNSRIGGKQSREYLHGPWSETAAASKAKELNSNE